MDKLSASLLATFTFSLVHTLIPSHWLCFVVVGKAQGWKTRKTLTVAAGAGSLHVAITVALGLALCGVGGGLGKPQEETLERVSAFILIGLGVLYLGFHLFHAGHHHESDRGVPEKAAIAGLLFSLVVSPCSAAIPFLIASASSAGYPGIALIGGVLLVTTVGVMLVLVGLTSLGIEKLQFQFFDKYEKLIVGLVLCTLGAFILLLSH